MPVVLFRIRAVALALSLAAALAACGESRTGERAVGTDDFGEPVHAGTSDDPARIVSLNPTTTELLFALGAGSRLVGRTTWDVVPDSARLIPDLGAGLRPNVEAVLARRPDLAVLYASEDNRAAAAQLADAGVDVIALKIDSIADFERAATMLGAAVGRADTAEAIIARVRRALEAVRRDAAGKPRPRVAWLVWHDPLIVIGAGSYLDQLLEIAGGTNVYGDIEHPSPQVALEDLLRQNPDVILVAPDGLDRVLGDPAWQTLRAVRERRVLAIDTLLVGRPSVRMGEAAASLARLLHGGGAA